MRYRYRDQPVRNRKHFAWINNSIHKHFWGGDGLTLPSHFTPKRISVRGEELCELLTPPGVFTGWIHFWSGPIQQIRVLGKKYVLLSRAWDSEVHKDRVNLISAPVFTPLLSQGIFHTNYSFPDNQTLYTDILMPRKDLKKNMCVCWWEEVYVCVTGSLGQWVVSENTISIYVIT